MRNASCLLIILSLLVSCTTKQEHASVQFFEGSWEEALAAAALQQKYVYVDMVTAWCGPCKDMDKHTYTDPRVAAFMHEYFIPLKRDATQGEGLRLAMMCKARFAG